MIPKIAQLIGAALMATAGAAGATPFDGLYQPAGSAWSCHLEDLYMDGGAVGVMNGQLHGVESVCDLTNPTPVRDMNAVLYDLQCMGEGEPYTRRVMLMRHQTGIFVIQNGFVADWRACP